MLLLFLVLFVGYVSIFFVRSVHAVGNDWFDIGSWVILPALIILTTLSLFLSINFDLTSFKNWEIFRFVDSLKHLIKVYLLFILVFSFFYWFFLRNFKPVVNEFRITEVDSHYWIILFVVFFALHFLFVAEARGEEVKVLTGNGGIIDQIKVVIGRYYSSIMAVLFFLVIYKIKNPFIAFYSLLFIVVCYTIVSFALFATRGSVAFFLMSGALLDTIVYKGQLMNRKRIFLILIGGSLFLAALNVMEAILSGGGSGSILFFLQIFEYRPFLTAYEIITAVDNGELPLRYGMTYIEALYALIPSQLRLYYIEPLSVWYVKEFHPQAYETGTAFAFSAIAEGYLNFGLIGVVIEAIIFAWLASLIYKIRYRWGFYGPLIYALSLPLSYKILRTDVSAIIHRFEWIVIIVVTLLIWKKVVSTISCQYRYQRYCSY